MSIQAPATPGDRRQRRALQLIFIFTNLVLVEIHVPGIPWVLVGAVFWIAMVLLAVLGGSWMCGWMCWIGGIQDLMEPLARSRLRLNSRWGQGITLALLVIWVPLFWWLFPNASSATYSPFGINLEGWPRHVFQLGLMLLVGLSVTFLGKRGICRYLCPFNGIVGIARRGLLKIDPIHRVVHRNSNALRSHSEVQVQGCSSGCQHCPSACQNSSIDIQFIPDLTIPLIVNHPQPENDQERSSGK